LDTEVEVKRVLLDVREKAGTRTYVESVPVEWSDVCEKASKKGRHAMSKL